MPDKTHLIKIGDRYYFRRRVPTRLRKTIGRAFVKKALGTSSIAEARKLRAIEEVRADALFAAAEQGLAGKGAGTAAQPVAIDVLSEYVREAVQRLDRHAAQRLASDPPATADERAEMREDAELNIAALRDVENPSTQIWVQKSAEGIAKAGGIDLDDPAVPFAELFEVMRRGLLEVQRRKLDRLADDHSGRSHDHLFDRTRPAAVTFGQLCETFLKEQIEEYEANKVSQKRIDNVRSKVAMLREIIGDGVLVHKIDDDVVRAARVMLSKVPNNKSQLYPKLTLAEAIEKAAKDGKPTLAAPTQEFYLILLRAIMRVGVRKKLLTGNPAEGLRPLTKDALSSSEKRRPFTNDQLKGFFEGKFYTACAMGDYNKADRNWRFWVPLIALLSGARPNEICSLTVADFGITPAGTRFFSVDDEGEGKTVKTSASRRRVPIHPELVKIGLLDFVERRRKADGASARLFPDLKGNKHKNNAWYAVKRINERFLSEEIDLEDRQSFYSLRHNVRDALRRVKASPEALKHIAGWSPGGKVVSDNYGDASNPDFYADVVAAISYEGLNLEFLYGKG